MFRLDHWSWIIFISSSSSISCVYFIENNEHTMVYWYLAFVEFSFINSYKVESKLFSNKLFAILHHRSYRDYNVAFEMEKFRPIMITCCVQANRMHCSRKWSEYNFLADFMLNNKQKLITSNKLCGTNLHQPYSNTIRKEICWWWRRSSSCTQFHWICIQQSFRNLYTCVRYLRVHMTNYLLKVYLRKFSHMKRQYCHMQRIKKKKKNEIISTLSSYVYFELLLLIFRKRLRK